MKVSAFPFPDVRIDVEAWGVLGVPGTPKILNVLADRRQSGAASSSPLLNDKAACRLEGARFAPPSPVVVAAHAPRLTQVLNAARGGGTGLAIIATAPHASEAALAAARSSDLTLVPCRASVADLHAIGASLDICRVA